MRSGREGEFKQIDDSLIDDSENISFDDPNIKKKGSLIQGFMDSIDGQLLEQMRAYLSKHEEEYRNRKLRQKIYLYEDISWIVRFKEKGQNITSKTVKQLTQKMDKEFKRSAVTIKDRIQKFLSKLPVDEIRRHMKANADFNFNSKRMLIDEKLEQQKEVNNKKGERRNVLSYRSENKQFRQVQSSEQIQPAHLSLTQKKQNSIKINADFFNQSKKSKEEKGLMSSMIKKEQGLDFLNNDKVLNLPQKTMKRKNIIPNLLSEDCDSGDVAKSESESFYRYGTKPVKQKIYILYDNKQKSSLFLSKAFIEENFYSKKEQNEKVEHQETAANRSNQKEFAQFGEEEIPKVEREEEDQAFGGQLGPIQEREEENQKSSMLVNKRPLMSESAKKMKRDFEETKRRLSDLMLCVQQSVKQEPKDKVATSSKRADDDDISSVSESERGKRSGKLTKQQSKGFANEEERNQCLDLLYKVSNNKKSLQIINARPSLKVNYIWEKEEDQILQKYEDGNPETLIPMINCLLRYKSIEVLNERLDFLGIWLSKEKKDLLNVLWKEKTELRGKSF